MSEGGLARWSAEAVLEAAVELVAPFIARDAHVHLDVKGALGIVVGFVPSSGVGFDSNNRTGIGLVGVRHGG